MPKSYLIYQCTKDKDQLLATAPNLRDVLAVGSHRLNEAISKNFPKPEFKVQSCDICSDETGLSVDFKNLPLDIQVGAKIVARDNVA